MQVQTQFSVFLVNKPGVLAQIMLAMAKAKINVMALTLVDSSEHGVLRLVCQDAARARQALARACDNLTETDVLAIEITNEAGAFADAAQRLAGAHVNINYAYCTSGAPGGHTTAIFKVADMNKALKVLKQGKTGHDDRRTVKTARGKR